MKKIILPFVISLLALTAVSAQGLKVGDKATDFKLKNIDGKEISLSSFSKEKGVIVIFSCNHCPFVIAYEDRMIAIDKKYKALGYPIVAINSNDVVNYPDDSFDKMIQRAKDKGFTFPYVIDETQDVAKAYGATKTPHVYLLKKEKKDFVVKYIGTIDDNYEDASAVKINYLTNAIDELLAGKPVTTAETKAIGCSIKWKK